MNESNPKRPLKALPRLAPLPARDVHLPRALLVWMALAAAGGSTNVIAFIACNRFVTHVTGIATTIGLDAADFEHALDYSLILLSFILGAAASEYVLGRGSARRGIARSLFSVALILVGVATAGRMGAFDFFREGVEDPRTFFFLGALAFAMGLQNGAISTATGNRVRTTHMTGPATDLGVSLARLRSRSRKERVGAWQTGRLRLAKISGFILGAAGGALAARFEYLALLLPATLCTVIAVIFVREPNFGPARKSRPLGDDAVNSSSMPLSTR